MKNSILSKFFSSGIQAIAVQVLGIFFFYFISIYLSKEDFGLISWANALCMFLTTMLSCGLEQVVVRRIAVSKTSDWASAAFMLHSFIGSVIMLSLIICLHFLNKDSARLSYLPLFFLAQCIIYIASPLKQFLNAKEKFTPYAIIALFSNSGKLLFIYFLIKQGPLSIKGIICILIVFAVFELMCLMIYILVKPSFNFSFKFKFIAYQKLVKEAAPQYISVIFDSGLSRMDWILLGLISTNIVTADYSFAYRAFEIARLPIAIIAPIILPVFARALNQNNKFDNEKATLIKDISIIEMFLSTGIFLCANILWIPIISSITGGKYGASNSAQFFILSLCLPLIFFINLLWTLSFSGKKYKSISMVTIICAIVNLLLNLILIPLYGGVGAAIAFLITSIIQAFAYIQVVKRELHFPVIKLLSFYLIATGIFFIGGYLNFNTITRLICSPILYVAFCIILQLVTKKQLNSFKSLLSK